MDESSKKRSITETGSSHRRSISSYQSTKRENTGIRSCSRLSCSTRHNSVKENAVGDEKKLKNPRAASRISNNVLSVRPSKLSSSTVNMRKLKGKREQVSVQETVATESSSRQEHGDESGLISSHAKIELSSVEEVSENNESESLVGPSNATGVSRISESPDLSAKLKSKKVQIQHNLCDNQDVSSSDPVRKITTPRNASKASKTSQGQDSILQLRGLRNVTSSSASNVSSAKRSTNSLPKSRINSLQKRSSLGGDVSNAKTGMPRRNCLRNLTSSPVSVMPTSKVSSHRSSVGDVSTTRSQSRSGSSTVGISVPSRPEVVKRSTTLHRVSPQSVSRITRNQLTSRNNASLAASQRSETKTRQTLPTSGVSNSGTVSKPSITRTTRLSNRGSTTKQVGLRRGLPRSTRVTHDNNNNNRRQECLAHDSHRVYPEETSQERFDHGYYDQHRDMRLDIDNMSYEELLALGESIGIVSTALSEEALSNCLKRSTYEYKSVITDSSDAAEDDTRCSICQEEYVAGDEVGKLICEHLYHVDCIHQWLQQKNWCPICKSHASPSYTVSC